MFQVLHVWNNLLKVAIGGSFKAFGRFTLLLKIVLFDTPREMSVKYVLGGRGHFIDRIVMDGPWTYPRLVNPLKHPGLAKDALVSFTFCCLVHLPQKAGFERIGPVEAGACDHILDYERLFWCF